MGYETMAAFYNLDIVTNAVPRTWKELGEQSSGIAPSNEGEGSDEGRSSEGSAAPVLAGVGLGGRFVQNSADLTSLFLVQSGLENYENLGDNVSSKALGEYLAFGLPAGGSPS